MNSNTQHNISAFKGIATPLFNGVIDFQTLKKSITRHSKFTPKPNELAGAVFEFVQAMYFKWLGNTSGVQVFDYTPTLNWVDDFGADGYGWDSSRTKRIVIQAKYRSVSASLVDDPRTNLDTYVSELIKSYNEFGQVIGIISTTTNENASFGKVYSVQSMNQSRIARTIHNKLILNGITSGVMLRVYDIGYWKLKLNDVLFWEFLRNQLLAI